MGFISSADTVTVRARLTKGGRKKILENTNIIFRYFTLGDSDANYRTSEILPTGKIPSNSGDLGSNSTTNDNIAGGVRLNSKIYVTTYPGTIKQLEANSTVINDTIISVGETTVSGDNLTYVTLNKNSNTVDFTNLFKSLSLPITSSRINLFTGTTNNGWQNTAFSGFANTNVLLASIDNDSYGEMIDGKSIKCSIPIVTGYTSGGTATGITTYDIYSTFPKVTGNQLTAYDNWYKDETNNPTFLFGPPQINVAYLVSDNIQRPNNDPNKSWSTGYDTFKPFSVNNKELININSVAATSIAADRIVGIAYLDKGMLAFTDPDIVNNIATNFSGDSDTDIVTNSLGLYHYTAGTFNTVVDSIQNDLVMNLVCIAGRGQFYNSENETIGVGDDIRISEVAIVDSSGEILAIGKTDRHIIKKKNDFVIFDVQIII